MRDGNNNKNSGGGGDVDCAATSDDKEYIGIRKQATVVPGKSVCSQMPVTNKGWAVVVSGADPEPEPEPEPVGGGVSSSIST